MRADAVFTLAIEASIVLTIALLLVLLLRTPWRPIFGASSNYALWIIPPLSLLTLSLPLPEPVFEVWSLTAIASSNGDPSTVINTAAAFSFASFFLSVWIIGFIASLAIFAVRQLNFRRSLGQMQPQSDGSWMCGSLQSGPMAIGLFQPKILIPEEFCNRFNPQQQAMALAHERIHIQRGDLWANALANLVSAVFWFHPLVHFAQRKFRCDQELACDARVLREFPQQRRTYADALLCAPTGGRPSSVTACPWSSHQFMTERLKMIQRNPSSNFVRQTGVVSVICLALGICGVLWSMDSSETLTKEDRIYFTFESTIKDPSAGYTTTHEFELGLDPNKLAKVTKDLNDGGSLDYLVSFSLPQTDQVFLSMELTHNGNIIGEPALLFGVNPENSASIQINSATGLSYELAVKASRQASSRARSEDQQVPALAHTSSH